MTFTDGSFVRVQENGAVHDGVVVGEVIALLARAHHPETSTGRSLPLAGAALVAPVSPSKVVGVGRNYRAHVTEMGMTVPDRPSVFLKPPSAVCGPADPILLHPYSATADVWFEAELALVIGRHVRHVSEADALDYVVGYTGANDVSARDLQGNGHGITLAKGQDTFCPLGPSIVPFTGDEPIRIRCWINDELRQDCGSDELVFGFRQIVSFVSGFMTLLPGDVILTGSPAGSGPLFDGDIVRIAVGGAGSLTNPVRATVGAAE
ncbi:fumarylacetoacetate hydrolase family protein [Pseudonocardia sp. GCM10023141]|uniref:fumarylacetoacetate hydrolase family protein n=1 Tax=Pseudonocardia sp. GCM10023141 TaxID=3252653 RepID=UPI0036133AE8